MACLTSTMDLGHTTLGEITSTARRQVARMPRGEERELVKLLIKVITLQNRKPVRKFYIGLQEVEVTGPLKGMGLFTMERSTITSMVSTALTYIIILVQFRMST